MDDVSGRGVAGRWHHRLDAIAGGFLFFLAAFAPWGAGGTLPWARGLLVSIGWALGLLTLSKWAIEHFGGFNPRRWKREPRCQWPVRLMQGISGLLLLQIAVSVWNWRVETELTGAGEEFHYHDAIAWLPSTYDRAATLSALIRLIGFAGAFWGMRDWLLIRPDGHPHRSRSENRDTDLKRVHRMIWVLSINAALMGMIGILQRLDHSHHLLWLIELPESKTEAFFGSFPYRGNAAQYLNMIWPLGLGLWWDLRSGRTSSHTGSRSGESPHPLLLLTSAMIIISTMMAGSRAGIGVTLGQMGAGVLRLGARMRSKGSRWTLAVTFIAAIVTGWFLAGDFMLKRFENVLEDETLSGRTQIYETAHKMAADFPVWGTGADSFMNVSFLYRKNAIAQWPGYVHDDWLETRVTLGWIGLGLTVSLLASAALSKVLSGSVPIGAGASRLIPVGLLGVLAHAAIDFPFQIPSIQLTFLLILALFSVSGVSQHASRSDDASN